MKKRLCVLIIFGLLTLSFIYFQQDFISEKLIERIPFVAEVIVRANAPQVRSEWKTNWDKKNISLDELISGGPPRDGIPPIDNPSFISITDAKDWLDDREPVLSFHTGDVARAYPIQVLMWHEIVNDAIDDIPISVTYCPLCNAAIVFDRRVDGKTLTFGTSGMLRKSDLVMWDRQTESLWQQLTGEAIVGDLTGMVLSMLPSKMISFSSFYETFPNGEVLSNETGYAREYGQNPYVGYDESSNPFMFYDTVDNRLEAMERVVAFMHEDGLAYSYSYLQKNRVVNTEIGGKPVVLFWSPGTASAMHASEIRSSRDVGSVGVFSPVLDNTLYNFSLNDEMAIIDNETGTVWSHMGRGLSGALAGKELEPVLHFNHFWFAWQAFYPDTAVVNL